MLRLWPEVLEIGLFPGQCWLRRGARLSRADGGAGYQQQLEALRGLLAGETRRFGRFARADVFVTDAHAQIALLPWQANLQTQAQMNAYGKACLDAKGQCSEGEWSVHAGFRHFGAHGLAAAMLAGLVTQLRDVLASVNVQLRSVAPASAAAYWYHRPSGKRGTSVLLFSDASRLTAAVYEDGRLSAIDVESVFGATGLAASRLERRVQMRHAAIRHVEVAGSSVSEWHPERLGEIFQGAVIMPAQRARWSLA